MPPQRSAQELPSHTKSMRLVVATICTSQLRRYSLQVPPLDFHSSCLATLSSAGSPSKPTFTNVASGTCTTFGTISVILFTLTQTGTPVAMAGTYTRTSYSSPTNPGVTCASVLSTTYTVTQTGFSLTWSGIAATSDVYDQQQDRLLGSAG